MTTSVLLCFFGCIMEERATLLDIRSSLTRARSSQFGAPVLTAPVRMNWQIQRMMLGNLTVFSAFHELLYLDLSYNKPCSLSCFEGGAAPKALCKATSEVSTEDIYFPRL
ncbi:uncharacterized protein LOC112269238 [Brachypodium distachyon]|uniref:Uncharacterized protein n=1 Tax=Brachypodium distachyon TaxID=15368 RepID=A0A2K2CJ20_BRADI|nr:uncharacterized protein LOC112269238 [Brachypodium distachyon]PNT62005.1 hypothetical protein BRADI_5g23956v3 [Brachypodium distachyon]|eukprot:XP_024311246.1 uncharacterized protein LOC112269238 [Brachypodium distachyon]